MEYTKTNSDIIKKDMIAALEKSLGIVTTACKNVGLPRGTHYRWLGEDPEYKKACESIEGVTMDFVESQLHKQIQGGNPASTIFYLKTKGKKRGYTETIGLNIESIPKVIIEYVGKVEGDNSGDKD